MDLFSYMYTVDVRFCACLVWSQVRHSVPFLFVSEVLLIFIAVKFDGPLVTNCTL